MTSPATTTANALAATCPFCHTSDPTMTDDALMAGAAWQCVRCGQRWNVGRLATALAYAQYAAQ
jgi:hypothetical protein